MPDARERKRTGDRQGCGVLVRRWISALGAMAMLGLMLGAAGCRTPAPEALRAEVYRPLPPERSAMETPVSTLPSRPPSRPDTEDAPVRHGVGEGEIRLRVLQPGDRLEIYLHGIPEPQQLPAVIDENGFITMPLIGQVRVAGMTGSEVERLIERLYVEQEFYRQITCVVIPPTIQFFMRGEVRQPGRYPLTRDVTLLQAIALAGGYTEYAQPRRVTVLRGPATFRVNVLRVERGEDPSPPIEPGDIIVVPRRWW